MGTRSGPAHRLSLAHPLIHQMAHRGLGHGARYLPALSRLERIVPQSMPVAAQVEVDARATFARILELRAALPQAQTSSYLLPRPKSHDARYMTLHLALRRAALQAGCSRRPTL